MLTRRQFLALGIASGSPRLLSGCVNLKELQPDCPINWAPSLLGPVFYGYKDYSDCGYPDASSCVVAETRTAPGVRPPSFYDQVRPAMRVYYPTLDGTPANAAILDMCERFPLVLLIHGDCGGDPYYQWNLMPAQLARCGYVVAVTQFGGVLSQGSPANTAKLHQAEAWLRTYWEHKDRILPAPNTAVIGHSFGGTLAAQLATEMPLKAFVSLSGTFGQVLWEDPRKMLSSIPVPSLFCWNDADDAGVNASILNPDLTDPSNFWGSIGPPKHGVVFKGGNHGDYLRPGSTPTCSQDGKCGSVPLLSTDFVTTFISKYTPPEFDFAAFTWVPNSLFVRPQDLPPPPANGFYAGLFLLGFASATVASSPSSQSCVQSVLWKTSIDTGSMFVVSG